MKDTDITELARRISNLVPQVKDAAVSASIASAFICAVLSATRPSLEPLLAGKLEIYPPSMTMSGIKVRIPLCATGHRTANY